MHVPLPNARYHSLLGDNIFISGCQPFALVRQATNTWARRPAYQAQGGAMPITGSCTVHFKQDARVFEPVQPRLPEVSRCT